MTSMRVETREQSPATGLDSLAVTSRATSRATKVRPTPRRFRPDIEGLRAIAVVLVVIYHAGLGFPGGYIGVDVFFVISGFLITRQLVTMTSNGGIRALPTFYAHRVRRLLPAGIAVLLVTVVAARIWAPVLSVKSIATDALFASFYSLNYRLASVGTDYQHIGDAASPLQHFWSLGVEEQFYFIWPLVIVAAALLFRRQSRRVLTLLVIGVIALSTFYSITVTVSSAPWAYFSLHTRAWELGVGALIALTAVSLARIPRPVRSLAAVAGLGAIVASAFVYSDATPFPGTAAWLPVGGTALVIAAGCGTRVPAERILAEPLMQCLGKVSYSWYLWHWPMLIIIPMAVGHALNTLELMVVVWCSLVMAMISFFLIEEPARRVKMPNLVWIANGFLLTGTAIAAAAALIAFPPSLTGNGSEATLVASGVESSRTIPATMAAAIDAGTTVRAAPANLTPGPAEAAKSLPPGRGDGCHADFTQVKQGACVSGDPTGNRTVVLFGDSHMEQWLPAFDSAAKKAGWKVVSWTKSACPPATITIRSSVLNRTYTECDQWRTQTIAKIGALKPDAVVMSQSETVVPGSVTPATFAAATSTTLAELKQVSNAKVTYLQDIPIPGKNSPDCVAANLDDVRACGYGADGAYSYPKRHDALTPAAEKAGATVVDTQSWFCTDQTCPAVVGNLMVYRDDSHMTAPYSSWLAPLARSIIEPTQEG
ncbi:SGNH hydrolase domain-containing protein [soil metagenome]